jgi:hypothetical protein
MKSVPDVIFHEKDNMESKTKSKKKNSCSNNSQGYSSFESFCNEWSPKNRHNHGYAKTVAHHSEAYQSKTIRTTGLEKFDNIVGIPEGLRIGDTIYAFSLSCDRWFMAKVLEIRSPGDGARVKVDAPGFEMKKYNRKANGERIFYSNCISYSKPKKGEVVQESF